MEIIVEIKNVYGNELIYPVCETAKKLTQLTGAKTLTSRSITLIKSLGYKLTVKQREL